MFHPPLSAGAVAVALPAERGKMYLVASSARLASRDASPIPGRSAACWRLRLALLAVVPLLALWNVSLAAQQPAATLTGTITAEGGAPLGSASVVVVGTEIGTITGPRGHFSLSGVPVGPLALEIRYIGYRTERVDLELGAGEAKRVDVDMVVEAVAVRGVDVDVSPRNVLAAGLQGFEARRARSTGHFFDRQEITAMQPRVVTDVLRRVPGLSVDPSGGAFGTGQTARTARSTGIAGARACPLLYFVNGINFPLPRDVGINHYIRPDEIAGIEVYSGASRIPAQFDQSRRDSRCGVVVIWTRAGEGP